MRRWAFILATVLAISFAYDLTRIPVQVSDSLNDILEAQAPPSALATFIGALGDRQFLRPLKAAQIRVVSDASGGSYTLAYRGVHVLLLVLTIWMFVRVLQVRTGTDLAAAVFALTVLLGLNTFANLLREAYPINHFLEMILFALIAVNLAQGTPHWISDAAAALLFAAAALIVESGLLIWVVVVAARLSGMRGVSWRGVAAVSALLAGYVFLRVVAFSTGIPTVDERSSGFLLRVLEPDELRARFGDNALPFYAYNVVASALTVLFAEPRAGLFVAVREYLEGDLAPWILVAVVTSSLTTVLIAIAAFRTWRDRSGREDADRFYFVFLAVLAANAVLSFAYTKDDIMSLAGAFYALAAYAAVRRLIRVGQLARPPVLVMVAVALLVVSTGWAMRTAGLHYGLRYTAFKTRNDWTAVPERALQTPQTRAVTERLQADAFERRVLAPRFYPAWQARWFEE